MYAYGLKRFKKAFSFQLPIPVSFYKVIFAERVTPLVNNANSKPLTNSIPAIGVPLSCFVLQSPQEVALNKYLPEASASFLFGILVF